jgi:hypothetical protein
MISIFDEMLFRKTSEEKDRSPRDFKGNPCSQDSPDIDLDNDAVKDSEGYS